MALIATFQDGTSIRVGNDEPEFVRDLLTRMNPSVQIVSLEPEVFEQPAGATFADAKAHADAASGDSKKVEEQIREQIAKAIPAKIAIPVVATDGG